MTSIILEPHGPVISSTVNPLCIICFIDISNKSAFYYAESPDGGPEGCGVRFVFTMLFPK